MGVSPPEGIAIPSDHSYDLLAIGGVIGVCEAAPSYLGKPTTVRLLGLAAVDGHILNTQHQAIRSERLQIRCPLIIVAGTAAEVGKTTFASNLIHYLAHRLQKRTAATKLAGTGRLRDLLSLRDAGATPTLDFVDAGLATTYGIEAANVVATAKGILNRLDEAQPEIIVAELGGDIIGAHVADILADSEVRAATKALVLIPSDGLAAYGALTLLRQDKFPAPLFTGLPIRNPAASRFRADTLLQCPMLDALDDADLAQLAHSVL